MISFFDKTKGSVSIFLILVLFPIYTCAYLAIDSARYSAAKDKALGAMQLSGNAALADYDKTFKELYGIFVMSKTEEELTKNLISYYSNMVDIGLSFGDTSIARELINKAFNTTFENTINTSTKSLEVQYESPIYETETLENSIRSFMKYRAPYNWVYGMAQKVSAFTQVDKVSNVIDSSKSYYKSVSNAEAELQGVYEALKRVGASTDVEATIRALRNVKNLLPSVKSQIASSREKSDAWNGSIENLEDGEAKKLLSSEYNNSIASLNESTIDDFSYVLQRDIDALSNSLNADDDEEESKKVELQFSKSQFYVYLTSMYGSTSTSNETASSQKAAIETIASTDLSNFTGDVANINIPDLIADEISKTINDYSSELNIGLSGLSGLKNAAGNAYEMEYILGMFGCLTTEETDENLMGAQFGSRPLLKGETEYIIFGRDNMITNVVLSVELIFAIRLVLNSLYVYTNANMRQSALAVATAIAGWTGIGIPVAQNALLIAWATAESILDVSSLCKGETVPIYKTASTWTLGLQSVPGTVAKGVANYASKAIDDVFNKIENISINKTDEIKDAALSYMNQAGQGAVESLSSLIITPVEKVITSMTASVKTNYSRDEIEAAILKAVNSVDTSSKGAKAAKDAFINYCLSPLVDKVYASLPSIFTSNQTLASEAGAAISNAISDAYSTMFSKLEGVVETYTKEAEDMISSTLSSASDRVKEETINVINSYASTLSEFVGESKDNSISSYSGMGMTYKDYLKLFSLIVLATNKGKENMLKRCTIIMQINCSDKSAGFNITKCFTSVRLCTVTSVGAHNIKLSEVYHY